MSKVSFSEAIEALKEGKRVQREGWNGWLASQTDMLAEDWIILD